MQDKEYRCLWCGKPNSWDSGDYHFCIECLYKLELLELNLDKVEKTLQAKAEKGGE